MNVAVVCGGDSSEREVSLETGKAVYNALLKSFSTVNCLICEDIEDCVEKILKAKPDIVFIALHGGFGENGQLQAVLESMGVKFTGCGFRESVIAMDKFLTKSILRSSGIPTSEFTLIKNVNDLNTVDFYPVCIKPQSEGSSVDVQFANNKKESYPIVKKLLEKYGTVLIERKLNGKELTVGIVHDIVLPVIHIKPKGAFYDYKHKYTKGATEYIVPAPLNRRVEELVKNVAFKAFKAIGCSSYGRVDIILDGNVPYVLEINTIPGMTATSLLPKAALAYGMSFEELVKIIVEKT